MAKTSWPIFIRQWRKHAGLTLEGLAAKIEASTGRPITYATLSRIERGKIAYTQPVLEGIAGVIGCTPGDLISRAPSKR